VEATCKIGGKVLDNSKIINFCNDKRQRGKTDKEVDRMEGSGSPEYGKRVWHPILPSEGEYE
jgi:hypothetical protein